MAKLVDAVLSVTLILLGMVSLGQSLWCFAYLAAAGAATAVAAVAFAAVKHDCDLEKMIEASTRPPRVIDVLFDGTAALGFRVWIVWLITPNELVAAVTGWALFLGLFSVGAGVCRIRNLARKAKARTEAAAS